MKKFDVILVLDTAMSACSAGVYRRGYQGAFLTEDMPQGRGQSERLVPMIGDALAQSGVGYEDLEAIVVTCGPGAFTGLRIGLSTAKALSLSLGIPVFGVSTLQAIAFAACRSTQEGACVRVLIETRRDDFYVQDFVAGTAVTPACALSGESIQAMNWDNVFLAGDAVERFFEQFGGENEGAVLAYTDRVYLPAMVDLFIRSDNVFDKDVEPIYLRGAEVSASKKKYRRLSL